ncbi:MAG: DNA-binding response regulator, partial [Pseudomonadota bacterium]
SKYKKTPILILTSVREEAARRRYELEMAMELDVDDYVEKPISPDILLERVGKLLKKKEKV